MKKLSDVLQIENNIKKQATLKKVFMPYSGCIDIDGFEKEALTVLLNLSSHHKGSPCGDWLDIERAKSYLKDQVDIDASLAEIKWFHTHNVKYPDCRVRNQRILSKPLPAEEAFISSSTLQPSLGWAHNATFYRHTIWLLNTFRWQSQSVSIVSLIQQKNRVWLDLLTEFGLSDTSLVQLQDEIESQLVFHSFPDCVSPYSKQLRFPWNGTYLTLTPVVSHAMQSELEHRQRDEDSHLQFMSMVLPNSASIGNLCGSVGGNMKVLSYPLDVLSANHRLSSMRTLAASRQKSEQFFDDYQVTNTRICEVLKHLTGAEPLKTSKQRLKARKDQSKYLRQQIALWMLPLFELRDRMDSNPQECLAIAKNVLVQDFLTLPESELPTLLNQFNQQFHFSLQENKYARKFAYHPKLMQVAKAQIKWILNRLSKPQEEIYDSGDEQYIYLSSLRIQDALAMSSPYLCGVPSLTAIWGVVHQYQREFNRLTNNDVDYDFTDFAIYIRSQSIQTTAKLTEPNALVKKRILSNAKRPTICSERRVDLNIDLVIKVEAKRTLSNFVSELECAFPIAFAGGSVFQPHQSSKIDWIKIFNSRSSLFYILMGLPAYGKWVYPCDKQPENFDDLELLLSQDDGCLPVSNGYHLLEQPTPRKNALSGLHVYAENTLGVAKQVNPVEMRFSGKDHFFKLAFWSIECSPASILIKKKDKGI